MDFNARQYDPQIGRFLGVHPLADFGGQDRYSPYVAMGNMPESMIDPNGLSPMDGDVLFPASPDGMSGTGGGFAGWGRAGGWAVEERGGGTIGGGGKGSNLFDQFNLNNFGSFIQQKMAEHQQWQAIETWISVTEGVLANGRIAAAYQAGQASYDASNDISNFSFGDPPAEGKSGGVKTALYDLSLTPELNYKGDVGGGLMNGAQMYITYKGNVSGYSELNWMQSYWTTNSQSRNDKNGERIPDGESPPFYYSYSRIKADKIFGGYSLKETNFADRPGRSNKFSNYSWEAELSLVGFKNGQLQNIITFRWGYISPALLRKLLFLIGFKLIHLKND